MKDLISREAAIDAIESHLRTAEEPYYLHDTDKIMNHAFEVAASCVYNLPSAEPERKKGHWINDRLVTTNGGTYAVRRCPFCESYYQDVGYGWNYCPNCGADMRGGEDAVN